MRKENIKACNDCTEGLTFFFNLDELTDRSLPNPELLDYYNRLARREIMLNCEIDDTCVEYAKQIIDWNREDSGIEPSQRRPIKIYIHSGGGSLYAAWSLIDAMILSKTPIITIGLGCIYSAASMIFIAGHKRYCAPHSTYMIHDGHTQTSDNVAKVLDTLEFTKAGEEKIKQYYVERTKITPELYDKQYRSDWYLHVDEMKEYGIIDSVVTDLSEI